MWRDRTNLYISYRQSFAHHPTKKPRYLGSSWADDNSEERRGLMSGAGAGFEDDGDAIIEMDLLPPRWLDVQDEVTDLLRDIAQKSAQLDRLHQKHVLPSFGDEDARREEEGVIERLTQEITRAFHDCQRNIMKIETMVREARQTGNVSQGEETMARNLQISLASRVQEASAGFRKKQSIYLKSNIPTLLQFLSSSLGLHILYPSADPILMYLFLELRSLDGLSTPLDRSSTPILQQQNPYTDPSLLESDADKSYSQSTLLQTSQHHQQQRQLGRTANDAVILQREREINDIAKGIIELSDIFRDLQTMIIDQGTMLDRIDYNVERMAVDVKAADRELTVVCLGSPPAFSLLLLKPD
ncbi:t-SNARE affecting a late Golgi compartment protein 2 [Emydomyces testavorans]|uniref:t-SNARE affecting a late Golgi compartment protein 2 n=1 Tax=Emydomyces testavorans TaxID=2070801 RepID=A0AAF0DPX1_9EURO|nr:t-SNARE affecting a late Golgi compartment protein 2 [Emydomyces testavorans]